MGGQRFGRITDRQPAGGGPGGRMGTCFVRDDEPVAVCSFNYADIVTEATAASGQQSACASSPTRATQGTTSMSSALMYLTFRFRRSRAMAR